MSIFKRYFNNPHLFREAINNPGRLFQHTMTNLMDSFYDNAMDSTIDGTFKAVCLSGIEDQDNSSLHTDGYMTIIVKPLTDFGDMLPDPRRYKDDADEVNRIIALYGSTYLAKSDFQFAHHSAIKFGQIVNCYYEKGSITNSSFEALRFMEPNGVNLDSSFLELASAGGVATGALFVPGQSSNLGGGGGGSGDRYDFSEQQGPGAILT